MPLYEYECGCGYKDLRYIPVEHRNDPQLCECGKTMKRTISVPQPAITKKYGGQMALDSLNSGISSIDRFQKNQIQGALAGIDPTKKVIGRGFSKKK